MWQKALAPLINQLAALLMPRQDGSAALTLRYEAYYLHQRRCSAELGGVALGQSENVSGAEMFAFLARSPSAAAGVTHSCD